MNLLSGMDFQQHKKCFPRCPDRYERRPADDISPMGTAKKIGPGLFGR